VITKLAVSNVMMIKRGVNNETTQTTFTTLTLRSPKPKTCIQY